MDLYLPFQKVFRPRRLRLFYRLFRPDAHTRVLDLGGGAFFWDLALSEGLRLPEVTVVNLRPAADDKRPWLKWIVGDACSTGFADNSFDIVFSNSLIEHLGNSETQARFAQEVRRLAPKYFVQTPDRLCPIEPHFVTPFVHWLPRQVRRRMIRNWTVWGLGARPSQSYCDSLCDEIVLVSRKEMQALFPGANILRERVAGIPKSLLAVCGGRREKSMSWFTHEDVSHRSLTRPEVRSR
jgi:SAM-dependent methyltransferase